MAAAELRATLRTAGSADFAAFVLQKMISAHKGKVGADAHSRAYYADIVSAMEKFGSDANVQRNGCDAVTQEPLDTRAAAESGAHRVALQAMASHQNDAVLQASSARALYMLADDPQASATVRDEAVGAALAALGVHLEVESTAKRCVSLLARLCTQYEASSPIVRTDCVRRVASAGALGNIMDVICPTEHHSKSVAPPATWRTS